jgi:hypothetical protein
MQKPSGRACRSWTDPKIRQQIGSTDPKRLRPRWRDQGRVVLAIDGRQPDVGHEVLGLWRDGLWGAVRLARSRLSATAPDRKALIDAVREARPVPLTATLSAGPASRPKAVAQALSGVPHPLCPCHSRRAAAKPISAADRHAPKELPKRVGGVRRIERQAEAAGAWARLCGRILSPLVPRCRTVGPPLAPPFVPVGSPVMHRPFTTFSPPGARSVPAPPAVRTRRGPAPSRRN